jgi:hypothetical protein
MHNFRPTGISMYELHESTAQILRIQPKVLSESTFV